ncbi:MAG TPA: hypothetical protein VIB38_09255 [Aestuariivirgaceae bacterium]
MRFGNPYLALAAITFALPVQAAEFTPLGVTELLTKSYVAAARCRFLHAAEQQELAGYFGYAKKAAAEIEGRGSAEQALERGRSSGETVSCTSATRREVLATLAAARRAMTAYNGGAEGETPEANN